MAWPESVPVLGAKDFCRYRLDDDEGRACLIGRGMQVFETDMEFNEFRLRMARVIAPQEKFYTIWDAHEAIVDFNNSKPLREVASAWNKCVRDLGYVVEFETEKWEHEQ